MDYISLSCDELVRACAEGNAEAWVEFVRRFQPRIGLAILRIMLRHEKYNAELIKDLVQETFGKLCANNFQVLRKFKPKHENAIYPMVAVMGCNTARDHYRKRPLPIIDGDVSEFPDFTPDPRPSTSDHLEQQIKLEKIDRILHKHCSPRDREIFWLKHRHGFTAAEIARMSRFNLTEKGVESVLHRLWSMVRQKLAEEEEDGDPDKAA
jgi:RNA polymerase sigma factor (sigma-70 family)